MTTLDRRVVKQTKKVSVIKTVSGDLSFSYDIVPRGHESGFGISARNMHDADKVIGLINRHGYAKASRIWKSDKQKPFSYMFGVLPVKEARKHAKDPYAYGDYVNSCNKSYFRHPIAM
ncbi:unnamed protein product [marine sediment metagenome]|uniref:Uncharacterized protein n=1 Tax=marine sediment metagenome TaxID=412755 RepID=X1B227_9ZZZZ